MVKCQTIYNGYTIFYLIRKIDANSFSMSSHAFSYEMEIVLSESISPSSTTTADGDAYVPMGDSRPSDIGKMN